MKLDLKSKDFGDLPTTLTGTLLWTLTAPQTLMETLTGFSGSSAGLLGEFRDFVAHVGAF